MDKADRVERYACSRRSLPDRDNPVASPKRISHVVFSRADALGDSVSPLMSLRIDAAKRTRIRQRQLEHLHISRQSPASRVFRTRKSFLRGVAAQSVDGGSGG